MVIIMKFRKFFKKHRDKVISIIVSVCVFIFVITLYNLETRDIFKPLRFFKRNELESVDLRFRLRGKRDPGKEIVIVAIDENSIIKLGRYPWPRRYIAKFVDTISDSGAKVLVFDIIYSESQNEFHLKSLEHLKESYLTLNNEKVESTDEYIELIEEEEAMANEDQKLQSSLKRAVMEKDLNIVIGIRFADDYELKTTRFAGKKLTQESEMLLRESAYFPVYVEIPDSLREKTEGQETVAPDILKQKREMLMKIYPPKKAIGVLNAIDAFAMWASYQGFTGQNVDYVGKVRNEYMAIQYKGDFYPCLGVQTARIFLDTQPKELQFWLAHKLVIKDLEIPLDGLNRMLIDYCGPEYTFQTHSFIDVYEGRVEPEVFKDKIVFLGAAPTISLGDFLQTPFTSMLPGVEKQATIVENIIHGKFLKRGQREALIDLIAIIGLSLLLGIVLPFVSIVIGGAICAALITGYCYYCYYVFVNYGLWINVVYPITAIVLCFSIVSLFRYFSTEKARRTVKGVFENFMDPKVVREVLKDPDAIKLGGEEKVVTVFFSDIAKFSTISEKLSPAKLIEWLNRYLSEMTDIIMGYGGYLDKYIGDAIVAAFGTPLDQHDHAVKACYAAIDNQKKLAELSREFMAEGLGEIKARIGINSGVVLVGNVGSQNRLSYTIIGDEVNLGARLEAANKHFGTSTMISENTYELAKDYIEARELDIIRVVGKEKPVKVYELIDKNGETQKIKRELLEIYEKGLEEYRKREWQKALLLFLDALDKDPNDGPSQTYLNRCELYVQNEPPEDWDGVYTMQEK